MKKEGNNMGGTMVDDYEQPDMCVCIVCKKVFWSHGNPEYCSACWDKLTNLGDEETGSRRAEKSDSREVSNEAGAGPKG